MSLEEELKQIAHCPKQVVHENPEYDCNFGCEDCPLENHSLCTSIVLEKLRVRTKKIRIALERAKDGGELCLKDLEQKHYDSMTLLQKNAMNYAVFCAMIGVYEEVLAELTTSSFKEKDAEQ